MVFPGDWQEVQLPLTLPEKREEHQRCSTEAEAESVETSPLFSNSSEEYFSAVGFKTDSGEYLPALQPSEDYCQDLVPVPEPFSHPTEWCNTAEPSSETLENLCLKHT